MKRFNGFFERLTDPGLLKVAARCAARGKKKRGSVKRFLKDEDQKLELLRNLLISNQYHPMPYTKKTIEDRCTQKVREIFVPKFYPDQIVQWAIVLVFYDFFTKGMTMSPCASIDGRGGTYGIKYIKKWTKTDKHNTKYCLVCDIKKFYPSIDQQKLYQKFERRIKDKKALELLSKIIFSVDKGVPIGNCTSQWFANFYLQDFDHFVYEKLGVKHYLRYMDDMVFFGANKRKLHSQQKEIEKYLKNEGLTLKANHQVFKLAKAEGKGRALDFLGYKFFENFVTVRKRTFYRAITRIKKVSNKNFVFKPDAEAVLSYASRLKESDDEKMYETKVKAFVNLKELRMSISRCDKAKNESIFDYSNLPFVQMPNVLCNFGYT